MYETESDPRSQNAPYHNTEETSIYESEPANEYSAPQGQHPQSHLEMPQVDSKTPSKSNGHFHSTPGAFETPASSEAMEDQSFSKNSGKKGPRTWSASSGSGPPRRRSHGSDSTLPPTFPVESASGRNSHADPSQSVSPSTAPAVMSLSNLLLPNEMHTDTSSVPHTGPAIQTDDDTEEEKDDFASDIRANPNEAKSKKNAAKTKNPKKARVSKSADKGDAMSAPPSKRRKLSDDFPPEGTIALPLGATMDVLENSPENANLGNLPKEAGALDDKTAATPRKPNGKSGAKAAAAKGSGVKRPRKKTADALTVKKRGTPSNSVSGASSKRAIGPSSARGKNSADRMRSIYDSHSSNSDGESDPNSRSRFRKNGRGLWKNSKLSHEATFTPSDSGDDAAGEDLNAHADVLNYIQHVRQRNHRVLEEYEAQCQLKRERLHKKFLARYERQVAAAKARQEEARRAEEERKRLEAELEAERLAEEQAAAEEAAAIAAAEAAELAKAKKKRRRKRRSKAELGQDSEAVLRMQEEEARRAYELAVEERTKKIWSSICRKHIPKVAKLVSQSTSSRLTNCRRIAQVCQREQRKVNSKVTKATRDMPIRARRVTREMLIFWKKNEKEERELRKKAEKEALERARVEEEMREARRQARKLNFLITQTELYSHFVGKKIGTEEAMKPGPGDTFAAPEPLQSTPNIHELHDNLDNTGDGDAPEMYDEIDFDEDDEVKLRQRARQAAQNALMLQQERTRTFDAGARERRAEAAAASASSANTNQSTSSFDIDDMNFQEPSMPSNHAEVHQPKMLTCTLKGYQLKGLNWLANLYEQGINGILADEMGLGKTVQSISLMAYLAETHDIWGPFLVIAPASTLHNWQQEISRFTPHLRALPYWGNVKDRKVLRRFWSKKQLYSKDAPFHVLITSYQLVVSDEKYFQRVKWQYMVLDEAQAIKSSTSARWKTLLGFNCRNRLLLTGTPIQNTMQELWALLHFIMPSLFDSHEEFSEWFSKDIEAASENKGTLNEHQLRRLHMILKPFMLRRVKKHVQNELGDKIELEVYCDLTARQRALYRGLKEKISISELLEKASADDGSVDSLMNLVMQFRKVCNHPELFERADVLTPFAMCNWARTSSMAREGDFLRVPYSSRATLSVTVPTMMHRSGGILEVPNEDTDYLGRLKCVRERLGVWTPEYIRRSMFGEENGDVDGVREANGAFSFLRFVDSSPQEASTAFFGPFMRRVANLIQARRRIGRRQFFNWVTDGHGDAEELTDRRTDWKAFSMFNISQTCPRSNALQVAIVSNALRKMSSVVEDMAEHHPLRKLLPAYMPKVIAPPPDVVCSDRAFTVKHEDYLFDCEARAAFNGISNLLPAHARSPLSGNPSALLLEETHGTPLISETFIDQGYSHVWVPALSKLVLDSGKLARLDALLAELKAGGHRVLIYFQMTRMIDLMEEYLTYRQYTYLRLDGSSKISERRDMVGDWQTRPDLFVFLLSTRAGGLGINLTAADTVIFYDSDWNPTVDQQAMDRAHRLGQTKQVTVYRLITKGTIEERILQRAKQKDEIQKVVMTGTGTAEGFKQQVDFNKPREIVSLLLDDEELEDKLRRQAEKRKIEEEAKANNKKKRSNAGGAGTPTHAAANAGKSKKSAPVTVRTLEDMWHEDEPAFQMDEEAEIGSRRRGGSGGGPPRKKSRKNSATTTDSSKDPSTKKPRPTSARSASGKFVKKSSVISAPVSASASTAGSVGPSSSAGASPAPNKA